MGFSLQAPAVGQPNSTEAPKITANFSTLQTWGNGQILGSDLSAAAAISRSQLAGGFGNLAVSVVNSNTSMTDGHYYIVTSGSVTMTLPTATANVTVGVFADAGQSGSAPVTITAPSGSIVGRGIPASTASIVLGAIGAFVVLVADGTNWNVLSGQQDTGWVAVAPVAPFTGSPLARLIGSRVEYSGTVTAASNQITGTEMATIPAGVRLPGNVVKEFVCAQSSGTLTVNVNGSSFATPNALFVNGSYSGGIAVDLSVISYRID